MRSVFGLFLLLVGAIFMAVPAAAEEYIRSYHADISVAQDASLTVTETITVNAEGNNIRRGIFRDFPLRTRDQSDRIVEVDFDLVSVERDGEPEAYHTEGISGGIRIYAGSEDTWLEPGLHTYRITYTTGRWILRYPEQDELYWNVNGNGWQFPVRQISATVELPNGAWPTETDYFTGGYGEDGKDARATLKGSVAQFTTTRPLGANEGLTILVGIPKGVLAEPTDEQLRSWFWRDYGAVFIGGIGLAAVFVYYLRSWIAVGRDPEAGVMVPRWDAPDGLSPALVNYVDNKGFSGAGWTALSASLIDLAVKGYVVLDDLKKSVVVRRTDKAIAEKLPPGQASLIKSLGKPGDTLTIDRDNGERVQKIGSDFRSAIEKEHRGRYYKANTGYVFGGVFLSIAVAAAMFVFGSFDEDTFAYFMVVVFLMAFVGAFAVSAGRGLRAGASLITRVFSILALAFIGFVGISIFSTVILAVADELREPKQWASFITAGGLALLNALFFFLMGAPTPLGRKLMDGIEGLRTYLTLAEKDRLNMAGAPEMSPQHFEKLLPYAVALGVEKPWTRAFDAWLATAAAGAAAASYSPAWYHGGSPGGFSDRLGAFSSSMASTIASTVPEPKSSSGGGGGFSGGGGGGGGGGGW
jgi:Predicted membrane protein